MTCGGRSDAGCYASILTGIMDTSHLTLSNVLVYRNPLTWYTLFHVTSRFSKPPKTTAAARYGQLPVAADSVRFGINSRRLPWSLLEKVCRAQGWLCGCDEYLSGLTRRTKIFCTSKYVLRTAVAPSADKRMPK